MKRFKALLVEASIDVPEKRDTLNIDRKDMPQIKSDDVKDFLSYLKKNDIITDKKLVDPSKLKATQGQFHKEKIKGLMDAIEAGTLKKEPILVSKDNYVIDGHHRWLAFSNLGRDLTVYQVNTNADKLLDLMKAYPKSFTQKLYEAFEYICESDQTCDIISPSHMKEFEKFVDRMFEKFKIDFNFTKHFRERMGDDRNKPCIKLKELADVIKKIYQKQGKSIKDVSGSEAVVKDIQSDLNIPIAVEYDAKNDEFDVVMKTIMRKRNFKTPNKEIKV
jgi:hypothetical protein